MPIPIDLTDNLSVSSVTEKLNNLKQADSNDFDGHFLTPSDTLIEVNISEAISKGDFAALEKILLTDLKTTPKNFRTPMGNLLHLAVSLARVDDFRKIFNWLQISPNETNSKDGSTPLHLAVRLNRLEIVEFLLELPEIDDTIKDFEGKTCLDYCRNRTIKTLFESMRKEKMMKFLFKAAYKNKYKDINDAFNNARCTHLIDFNSQNSRGDTLLHIASKNGSEEVLQIFLKLGIDPYIKNKKGKMAMEVTDKQSIKDILKTAPMKRSKEIPSSPVGLKMKGYLYKYTNIGFGYRPRWFVLENGVLSYYNSQSDYPVSCRGSLNLQYFRIEPHPKQACKFSLIGRSENIAEIKIHLRAEAQDEAKRWLIALQQSRDFYADYAGEEDEKRGGGPFLSANLMSLMNSPALTATPPLHHQTSSSQAVNEIDLTFMTILKQERLILESSLSISEKETILDNLRALKELLQKIEQLLAQKTRRLDAQRKEKDLLEDAVRSLAMENNKWQTWARAQLSPSSSTAAIKHQAKEDIFMSLENQLEATTDAKIAEIDTEDEFYDFESSSTSSSQSEIDEIMSDIVSVVHSDTNVDYSSRNHLEENRIVDKFGYPLKSRLALPVDSTKMPAISLWNILKNAIRQQDLTRMPIPINFSEPLSMLQRMCEDLEYFELIKRAREFKDDPAKRLLMVAAFAVTSYSSTDRRTLKPFNPLLGETFELACSDFLYLAEQVSHHPPIGASYCKGEGFEYWNEVHVTSRFRGKYLELKPDGNSHLILRDGNHRCEHFTWNRVNTAVNNIIVGKLYLEHYGKMIIKTHNNSGMEAEIEFLPNGWKKDSTNRIKGKIYDSERIYYEFSGRWNESIEALNKAKNNSDKLPPFTIWRRDDENLPPNSEIMYNFGRFAMRLNELNSELKTKLCPTDSRLRPDQRAMEEGHFDLASKLKVKLEEKQRKARKLQSEERPPRWFSRQIDPQTDEGFWKYLGGYWETRSEGRWTEIPDIYLSKKDKDYYE